MQIELEDIVSALDGAIPSPMVSCSADGVPNVTYLSLVQYVDSEHIALSFQFFNKTRANILDNPHVQVWVVEPQRLQQFCLNLTYKRTERTGPVFEQMKTRLRAIAAASGMEAVFRLQGADIYHVNTCIPVVSDAFPGPVPTDQIRHPPWRSANSVARDLDTLAQWSESVMRASNIQTLLDAPMALLTDALRYEKAALFLASGDGKELRNASTDGRSTFPETVALGYGLIGIAAQEKRIVRVNNMDAQRLYLASAGPPRPSQQMMREEHDANEDGLESVRSVLAIPLLAREALVGVLIVTSTAIGRFSAHEERLARIVASVLGAWFATQRVAPHQPMATGAVVVRHFEADDSVFLDDEYLIRGVPGRILMRILQLHQTQDRDVFTNKELRRDPYLDLPGYKDNLETRLLLLRRRLAERQAPIQLQKTGRGKFSLEVRAPIYILTDQAQQGER